jgi:hypothetical protein
LSRISEKLLDVEMRPTIKESREVLDAVRRVTSADYRGLVRKKGRKSERKDEEKDRTFSLLANFLLSSVREVIYHLIPKRRG